MIILFGIFDPEGLDEFLKSTGIELPLWISYLIAYIIILCVSLIISIRKPNMNIK